MVDTPTRHAPALVELATASSSKKKNEKKDPNRREACVREVRQSWTKPFSHMSMRMCKMSQNTAHTMDKAGGKPPSPAVTVTNVQRAACACVRSRANQGVRRVATYCRVVHQHSFCSRLLCAHVCVCVCSASEGLSWGG